MLRAGGTIRYRGEEITGWSSHRTCGLGIGQIAEGRQVFAGITVGEHLETGAYLRRGGAMQA